MEEIERSQVCEERWCRCEAFVPHVWSGLTCVSFPLVYASSLSDANMFVHRSSGSLQTLRCHHHHTHSSSIYSLGLELELAPCSVIGVRCRDEDGSVTSS